MSLPPWSICGRKCFMTLTVRLTNPLSLARIFCLPAYSTQTVLWLGYYTYCTVNVLICSHSYVWSVDRVNVLQSLWVINVIWLTALALHPRLKKAVCHWSVFYYTLPKIALTIPQVAITPDRVTRFMFSRCDTMWP